MDLFSFESARRIGPENVLMKVSALVDWDRIGAVLGRAKLRSGLGTQGYDLLLLFKCLLLGQWHGLSDPKLEESLKVRLDFMLFAGLDLHASVPDETTHCRFRNALVVNGVYDDLLAEICRQLEEHGLKVREAEAAIIDATLIASAARPRSHVEGIAEDRAEDETPPDPPDIRHSADPDATWVKKGRKSTLGYKGFARVDEEGFIDKVHVTPANVAECPEFETMIEGASGQRVLADKAYASKANRAALKGRHKDGIMRKAARGRPLRASEKRFNKLISKCRFRVEQVFGTAKRLFGLSRARYFGRARTHAQMAMTAIAMNLLKAANKISLTPPAAALIAN
jgi:IS5 family transposase